jgi:uncharacterized protein DUF4013
MSFSDALSYPFKGENIPKVLTIILVFLLLIAVVVVGGIMLQDENVVFLAFPIILAYAVFIGGYSIEIIRTVMQGHEIMPQPAMGRDILRGIVTMLAAIAHAIPLMVVYFCTALIFGASMGSFMSIDAYGNPDISGAGGSILMACGLGLAMLAFGFLLGYTYLVGMIRYAAEDRAGAMFDIGSNFSTVLSNMGAVFALLIRQIGIAIIYAILGFIVNTIFQGMIFNSIDPYGSFDIGIGLMVVLILYGIISLSLNLMNQISSTHLIAGFGADVGISTRKAKHDDFDDYNFD